MSEWKRSVGGLVHVPLNLKGLAPSVRLRKSIDPATGIAPMSEWGPECGRGFVTFKDAGGTHITKGGRKHRGTSFGDFEKACEREGRS